jgi:hypothetical protein
MCEHGFRALPIFVVVENPSRRRPLEAANDSNRCIEGKSLRTRSDTSEKEPGFPGFFFLGLLPNVTN